MDEVAGAQHGRAAELLSRWRAAERDTAGARLAELVAAAAMEAAVQAKDAAVVARDAARIAAEGAATAETRAEGDEARAGQNVADAEQAETDARDRFHESERRGFSDRIPRR